MDYNPLFKIRVCGWFLYIPSNKLNLIALSWLKLLHLAIKEANNRNFVLNMAINVLKYSLLDGSAVSQALSHSLGFVGVLRLFSFDQRTVNA